MMILYINDIPIGCLTSNSLSETISFIQTCKRTQKGAIRSLGRQHSYSIPFEAVYTRDGSIITYEDIQEYGRNREIINWSIIDSDEGIGQEGIAFLENLDISASSTDFIKFTGTLSGQGEIISPDTTYYVWAQSSVNNVDNGGNYVLVQ